jgi:hypothetical protein
MSAARQRAGTVRRLGLPSRRGEMPWEESSVVKHIVLWRLKEAASVAQREAQLQRIKCGLEGLRGRIPGLLAIEVGIDFCRDPNAADIVLYSEFADRAALARYISHPLHLEVAQAVRELASERRLVDYET